MSRPHDAHDMTSGGWSRGSLFARVLGVAMVGMAVAGFLIGHQAEDGEARVGPGGVLSFERVTCTSTDPGETCTTDIWSVNVDPGSQKRLTRKPTGEGDEAGWSPDGRRLAFVGRGYQIWTMNADGSRQEQLTVSEGLKSAPTWSPRGHRIAYGDEDRLMAMNALGDALSRLATVAGPVWEASWSPDGRRIVFSAGQLFFYLRRQRER